MAIATGDTVMLLHHGSGTNSGEGPIRTSPRLRGYADNVAGAAAAFVFWENGETQAVVPVAALVKVLDAGAPGGNFGGKSFKFGGGAQEAQGVFLHAYIAENDAGVQEGHLVGLFVGRGQGSPDCFIDVTLDAAFTTLPPGLIITTNVYPRY